MSLEEIAPPLLAAFQARGLQFDRFTLEGDPFTFLYPRGWQAAWKEDHASLSHGVPPQGWLTVYPVPVRQTLSPEELMDAFLDEFVEPAADKLSTIAISRLERLPGVQAAHFALQLRGGDYQGLALAWVAHGQARIVSYWIEEAKFRRPLIEDLLIAIAGTIQAPPGSRFAERQVELEPLPAAALWQDHGLELKTSFAAPGGRFALRLPEGWRGLEVSFEGEVGWLLLPPGVEPGDEEAPLISISGADLIAPLEEMLEEAISNLTEAEVYRPELPAHEIEVREQAGLVQLRVGMPPARPGEAFRLWSLGLTDRQTVVHLFAVAEAGRLTGLLPALNAIGRSLRVLPRQPNPALMKELAGYWRFLDSHETGIEVEEQVLHLRPDGSFGLFRRKIDPKESLENPLDVTVLTGGREDGRWEVVDQTLCLEHHDGSREIFQIESLGSHSAIIGKTIWERRG